MNTGYKVVNIPFFFLANNKLLSYSNFLVTKLKYISDRLLAIPGVHLDHDDDCVECCLCFCVVSVVVAVSVVVVVVIEACCSN